MPVINEPYLSELRRAARYNDTSLETAEIHRRDLVAEVDRLNQELLALRSAFLKLAGATGRKLAELTARLEGKEVQGGRD
jgi:hypothetical protein